MYPTPTPPPVPPKPNRLHHRHRIPKKPWFDRFKWGTCLLVMVAAVCASIGNSYTQNLTTQETCRAALVAAIVAFGGFLLNPKKADWTKD